MSEDAGLESLMQAYQQADAAAAMQLAERLNPKLFSFFLAQTRNRDKAEDLLQECWLKIHRARHTYRPTEPLLPWVYAIARHTQVDNYRRDERIARHEIHSERAAEIAASETAPEIADIEELLNTLPKQQRETVILLKVAGMSLEEVSRATGATVGAVKQRAHRAYTTLRRLMGGSE